MNTTRVEKTDVSIILPTFNEAGNIRPLLARVKTAMEHTPYTYEIIFVDDSTDETPKIVNEAMDWYPEVRLIHRQPSERTGLGTAFVDGFAAAASEVIVCMDSDLQHPPEAIPAMLDTLHREHVDMVVASRYCDGGSSEGLSSGYRQIVSSLSTMAAWAVLPGTRKTTDPMSGFFMFRAEYVENVVFDGLRGYKILVDLLTRISHLSVADSPIVFAERTEEESKSSLKQGIEYFKHLGVLWYTFRVPGFLKLPLHLNFWKTILVITGVLFLYIVLLNFTNNALEVFILSITFLLIGQGSFALYLMVYAWEDPARAHEDAPPKEYAAPRNSFTIIIPARREEEVIADTIRSVAAIEYPDELTQVLVSINDVGDDETIRIASKTIAEVGKDNLKLVTCSGEPFCKPHNLNTALAFATGDIVTIFDAEDDVHPEILSVIDSVYQQGNVDIVQGGVQLMNYDSTWFSLFNVLEYFFWFKSTLHFFAKNQLIPLGGNTVFFRKSYLDAEGGWDMGCLTEDADIGIRLSLAGAKTRVIYDERLTTREETPMTSWAFIKQRTRWKQGFMQIFFKADWTNLPSAKQQALALYVLMWPFLQGLLFLFAPFAVYIAFTYKMPVILGLLSLVPLYMLLMFLVVYNLGIYAFVKGYGFAYSPMLIVKSIVFFFPFQALLGFSAMRALYRQMFGNIGWEKTLKQNVHRKLQAAEARN